MYSILRTFSSRYINMKDDLYIHRYIFYVNTLFSAMGIDLPDYLLNYNGKLPVAGSYREKMERNGRR